MRLGSFIACVGIVAAFIVPLQVFGAFGYETTIAGVPGGANLQGSIATVVNVFLGIVAVIAAAFIVIAGFQYITAAGDESQTSSAKRTIMYSVIGLLAIGVSAVTVNWLIFGLTGVAGGVAFGSLPSGTDLPGLMIRIVNGFLALAGIIAAVFIVIGGFQYMTAGGDEGTISQAKRTILYAIVGLLAIGLSVVTVHFVSKSFLVTGFLFYPLFGFAGLPGGEDLVGTINTILSFLLGVVGIIAAVFVVVGGVRYMTAQGDERVMEEAKKTIIVALGGLMIVFLASAVVNFVLGAL